MSFPSLASFSLRSPRKKLTHERFEQFVDQLHKAKGASHFVSSGGEVLLQKEGAGLHKGSRRWNKEAAKMIAAYLEEHMDGRYANKQAQIRQACSALQATRTAKDFDPEALAEGFDGLLDLESLKPELLDQREAILRTVGEVHPGINDLPAPEAVGVPSDGASPAQRQRQRDSDRQLRDGWQAFAQACLPGEQQALPEEAKRFATWLDAKLKAATPTLGFTSATLMRDLDSSQAELTEAEAALANLLKQKDARAADPGFHRHVVNACDRVMRTKARCLQQLVFLSYLLAAGFDLSQVPDSYRKPLLKLAQAMAERACAIQAGDSPEMHAHRLAVAAKAWSARQLIRLTQPAAPPASPAQIREETTARLKDAKAAYAKLVSAFSTAAPGQNSPSDAQQDLRRWLQDGLWAKDATAQLPLAAVHDNLFVYVPERLKTLDGERLALARQLQADPSNKVLLSQMQNKAEEIDQWVKAYLAQLEVLSDRLLEKLPEGRLPADLNEARLNAGRRTEAALRLLRDPRSELMQMQKEAQHAGDSARQASLKNAEKQVALPSEQNLQSARQLPPSASDRAHMPATTQQAPRSFPRRKNVAPAQVPPALVSAPVVSAPDKSLPITVSNGPAQRAALRADWDLVQEGVAQRVPAPVGAQRWSTELENSLSRLDETVNPQALPAGKFPVKPIRQPRPLVRRDAEKRLKGPVPPQQAAKPAKDAVVTFVEKSLRRPAGASEPSPDQRALRDWLNRELKQRFDDFGDAAELDVYLAQGALRLKQLTDELNELRRRGAPPMDIWAACERLITQIDAYRARNLAVGKLLDQGHLGELSPELRSAMQQAGAVLLNRDKAFELPHGPMARLYAQVLSIEERMLAEPQGDLQPKT